MKYDVFISHASEDKEEVARPLAKCLDQLGIKVWLDELELKLGDSLRRKIERSLAESRFGIVIFSPDFFRKEWPQKELDCLIARDDGASKVILPIWHRVSKNEVLKYSPLLADKFAISTQCGIPHIANQVADIVKNETINKNTIDEIKNKELTEIYRQLICANSSIDLKRAFYSAETFVANFPNYVEGKILRDIILEAQVEQKKIFCEYLKIINNNAKLLNAKFNRKSISKGINFARLTDLSYRIDNTSYQIESFGLSIDAESVFFKGVYEYIIGNYDTANDIFDKIIYKHDGKVLDHTQVRLLGQCYYYRGLIEYNLLRDLKLAEKYLSRAVELYEYDFESALLIAEINFKLQNPIAFDHFAYVTEKLMKDVFLSPNRKIFLCHSHLGMIHCKVLQGGKKFLPAYYSEICRIEQSVISDIILWLGESDYGYHHVHTLLTLGQLAVAFEHSGKNIGLEPSNFYFDKAYDWIHENEPYEVEEEFRTKLLWYSIKLVCEKVLDMSSVIDTQLIMKELLEAQELKSVYSVFSKVNIPIKEYIEELRNLGISIF